MPTRLHAVLAASAAALALVAGCGDSLPDDDPDDEPTPTETSSPTGATSPSPSGTEPTPAPGNATTLTTLTTKGLAQGAAPAVEMLAADDPAGPPATWSLVRPDGTRVGLAVERPFAFATVGSGLVVLADAGEAPVLISLDGAGAEVTREDALGYRLAVSVHGNIVAWLAPDHSVRGVEDGQDGPFQLSPVEGAVEMGAIAGLDTCREAESDVGGCTAYVDVGEPRQAWLTTSHGIVDVAGSMLSVSDAGAAGQLLGLVSVTDEGSCGGLFTEPTTPVWQTCDHTLTRFSPSGRRVLATDAYLDGFGQRSVAFLDADDGALLHEFRSKGRGPSVLQTVWEDEDHVLAVVYERGRWSIVRLGADGSAELALGPLVGEDLERPFVLAEG